MPSLAFDASAPLAFLPLVKLHLRLDAVPVVADDDDLLLVYIAAAFDYVASFTNTTWPLDPAEYPKAFPVAALLLVGDLYEHREAFGPVVLSENKTVERLLWPLRQF